jgi:hypothetical protein
MGHQFNLSKNQLLVLLIFSVVFWTLYNLFLCLFLLFLVRNKSRILGCHKKDDTTQESIGKAKFTFAKGYAPGRVWETSTLGRKSTWV